MSDKSGKYFVNEHQLRVGKTISWSLYDKQGSLLLTEGSEITSDSQIESLIRLEAYYYLGPNQTEYKAPESDASLVSPYNVVTTLLSRLELSFRLMNTPDRGNDFVRSIVRLVIDIQSVCADNPNAALGTVQLIVKAPTSLVHSLHTALICEVAGGRLGWGVMERIPLIAAALTQNIGMLEIQQVLADQRAPLTDEQRAIVDAHPRRASEMLQERGVKDKRWLKAVLQHHERLDGSGYPSGLSQDEISTEARLLAIADSYVAMTRPRAYKTSLRTKAAMGEIFKQRGAAIDATLTKLFLKVMGVFTPGSLVRLVGGEVAVVVGQAGSVDTPLVALLTTQRSQPLDQPILGVTAETKEVIGVLDLNEHLNLVAHMGSVWPEMKPI